MSLGCFRREKCVSVRRGGWRVVVEGERRRRFVRLS